MKSNKISKIKFKVGDWVTQHSAGYWMIVDIKPKYANRNYTSSKISFKKGDLISNWIILKKGFTNKMKPSFMWECVDEKECQAVPQQVLDEILADLEDKKYAKKFNNFDNNLKPSIKSYNMNIPDNQITKLKKILESFSDQERFTEQAFKEEIKDYVQYIVSFPTKYMLYLHSFNWELDDNFNKIYFNPVLVNLNDFFSKF